MCRWRSARRTRRAPRPTQPSETIKEPEPETADLEPQTEPFAASYEAQEHARAIVIDERNADAVLLAQVAQQLSHSESAIEPLPRSRAARGTTDLEDEVTNIVQRPDSKPL